jgi:hypothetical protein
MSAMKRQLRADRALRDEAKRLLHADVAFLRADVRDKSIPARLVERVGDRVTDMADEAVMLADENRRVLGTGLAIGGLAVVAYLLRDQIRAGVEDVLDRVHR